MMDVGARERRFAGEGTGLDRAHLVVREDQVLVDAQKRLSTWRAGLSGNGGPSADATIARIRECLANDLDVPGALSAVDEWVDESLERGRADRGGFEPGAPGLVGRALDALLGIRL